MKQKNFEVTFVNYSFGDNPFSETGVHSNTTDQGLIEWFLSRKDSNKWQKISDITIIEELEGKHIDRTDLVMKIIKPRIFKEGEEVTPTYFGPLPGTKIAPPIVPGAEYIIKKIHIDKEGNQHLDLGIKSQYNYIRSYETKEELPDGDKIHWCHPGRVELVKK